MLVEEEFVEEEELSRICTQNNAIFIVFMYLIYCIIWKL